MSFVERGIRRMLEGADIQVDNDPESGGKLVKDEFSTEVRSYIASHFRSGIICCLLVGLEIRPRTEDLKFFS